MLGDTEGSAEGSGEGLELARGAGCEGRKSSCCCALELELVVLEFSCAVRRDTAK